MIDWIALASRGQSSPTAARVRKLRYFLQRRNEGEMAEVVHRNLELMLPELEELERSGIFSPHEIK